MIIQFSARARSDLREIYEYIATDSVIYARQTVRNIIRKIHLLEQHPLAGRKILKYADESRRETYFRKYRIVYCLTGSKIIIVTIHHSAKLADD
ncbi:MAG: type II toxin-antitoxin system RelE/ParE family toxin [Calditrichaeota bacterium]|nr:type II toxin-antitoxin system RelE/ParE family toxin [Calditrichota bacterium]